jgi:hypothetical protein
MQGAYPRVEHLKGAALPANIRLSWKGLQGTNTNLLQKFLNKMYHNIGHCQRIYHVGYTSYHSITEVKQHWAWIIHGWETLQGISGSAGTYPPYPPPLQTEYSLFRLSLSQSIKWLRPAETKNKKTLGPEHQTYEMARLWNSKLTKWLSTLSKGGSTDLKNVDK